MKPIDLPAPTRLGRAAAVGLAASTLLLACGDPAPDSPRAGSVEIVNHGATPIEAPSIAQRVAPKPPRGRVVMIGIDGASPRVVFPLIERGELPNLAKLAREGASGKLRSLLPISSPVIWNSIATGVAPEKHGITAFAQPGVGGTHQLFLSTDRKVDAIWNLFSQAGLSVGTVNLWNTYPPETLNGVVVSDHLLARQIDGRRALSRAEEVPVGDVIHPRAWQERLLAVVESDDRIETGLDDPFKDNDGLPRWLTHPTLKGRVPSQQLSRRWQEDEVLARIALEIERETHPDLLMVLLPGIDRISHFLWGVVEPDELYPPTLQASPEAKAEGRRALEMTYRLADALIGEILRGYGPDDLVIVLSDHGFEFGINLMMLTGEHEGEAAIDGVAFLRGAGIAPGSSTDGMSVMDVTPTILAFTGFPVAKDMDGSVAAFLDLPRPADIDTYGVASERGHATVAPSGVESEIVEQLRQLGYLE